MCKNSLAGVGVGFFSASGIDEESGSAGAGVDLVVDPATAVIMFKHNISLTIRSYQALLCDTQLFL